MTRDTSAVFPPEALSVGPGIGRMLRCFAADGRCLEPTAGCGVGYTRFSFAHLFKRCEVRYGYRPHHQTQALLLSSTRSGVTRSLPFEVMSKRRKGYPSETRVKKGRRIVHGEKELTEKLGRNDLCPCGSGRRFKKCCLKSGRYDGSLRAYYF